MCLIMLPFLIALPILTHTLVRFDCWQPVLLGLIAEVLLVVALNSCYRKRCVVAGVLALLVVCGVVALMTKELFGDFWATIITELVAIALTVLLIDSLRDRSAREREKRELKEREKRDLILRLGSPSNALAEVAARRLRIEGWLFDGPLQGANLINADLQGAELRKADLQGVRLSGADLRKAKLQGADLRGASLLSTKLQKAKLIDAKLQKAKLIKADLREAELLGAKLQKANLITADLREAKLQGADLQGAKLLNADLREANLFGVNLQEADLERAKLQGAGYSENTTWPDGFDPVAAGCILVTWD